MMYNNKLAIAIKADGKILREFKDTVHLPFGSEYTVLIKNLNTVRVQVRVSIDGASTSGDSWLIVGALQEVELTRFIKNNNLLEGNRFKFIERSAAVDAHRDLTVTDGLVMVEFQFERPPAITTWPTQQHNWNVYGDLLPKSSSMLRGDTLSVSRTLFSSQAVAQNAVGLSDVGITVPGSISNQQFTPAIPIVTEVEKHTMVIKLLGQLTTAVYVTEPITVNHKLTCVTCGKVNAATSKFCTECGTGLIIR